MGRKKTSSYNKIFGYFGIDRKLSDVVELLCVKNEYDNALEKLYNSGWVVSVVGNKNGSLVLRRKDVNNG